VVIQITIHISFSCITKGITVHTYRVIHKSLRDFRPLRYSSRDGHVEGEKCQQRERHPTFLSYLTVARYLHPWWRSRCQFLANSKKQNAFLFPVHAMFHHDCPLAVKPSSTPRRLVYKIKKLETFSAYLYAPFCSVCRGCAAKFGSSGETYELLCIYTKVSLSIYIYIYRCPTS
jgi:hypothetical protein